MVNRYIVRDLENAIRRLSNKYPIITVLGPRQSGKTTLLKQLFPDHHYVTLEAPDVRIAIQNDPRGFLNEYKRDPLIIDEFQRFPDLTSYLQEYADEYYDMGQLLLTGSQQYQIGESVSQSLAGRTAILKLLPLSLGEIARQYPPDNLEDTLFRGSYPAVFDRQLEPLDWYPSYVETYLERDVRQLLQIGNLDRFVLFLKILAGRAGQLLNLNNLGREVGISQPTARQWLSILQASQLVFTLKPLHRNVNQRMLKTPKLYFSDTGLLCYLLGIQAPGDLPKHPQGGAIFENFVISEFEKFKYAVRPLSLLFFRDKLGREVDLIIEQGEKLDLFEIKYSHTIKEDHYRHMKYIAGHTSIESMSVIYMSDQRLPKVTGWKKLRKIEQLIS